MENIRDAIIGQLQSKKIPFQHLTHRAIDPRHVAQEMGVSVEEGIKCLIMRGKKTGNNYLVCVLGHQKVDMKALPALIGENCEFEKIDLIKERFGLEVGAVPPFGALFGLEVYFDEGIQSRKEVVFSCGLVTESVRMQLSDLLPLVEPKFGKFANFF